MSLVQQLFERDGHRLRLRTIYLHDMAASLGEDFDPLFSGQTLSGQMRKSAASCLRTNFKDTDGATKPGYTFLTNFEFRYMVEGEQERLAAAVGATIATCYFIEEGAELDEKSQVAWGESSALFHAWPYWREFAHSALARLNLPVTLMPMLDIQAAIANADDASAVPASLAKSSGRVPAKKGTRKPSLK